MIGSAPAAGLAGAAPLAAGLGVAGAAGAAAVPVAGLAGTPDGIEGVAGVALFVPGTGTGRGGCVPATGTVVGARGAADDGDGERSDSMPLGVPAGFASVGGAGAAGLGASCAVDGGLVVCVCGAGCAASVPGVWGV